LLRLDSEAREEPHLPAATVLTPTLLKVLPAFAGRPLPEKPTVHHAYFAFGVLRGHLKHYGDLRW
jgi:hypothetical protein